MNFNTNSIQMEVGSVTYARGKTYYRNNRVKTLTLNNHYAEERLTVVDLVATVQGSPHKPYTQSITFTTGPHGELELDGYCSCPVGYNCKHVVAVYLKFAELEAEQGVLNKSNSGHTCLEWLDNFSMISQAKAQDDNKSPGNFLAYILSPLDLPGTLDIELRLIKPLKKGGYSKGRPINFENICTDTYFSPDYITAADTFIGKALGLNTSDEDWTSSTIDINTESFAIKKIIDTGRCYWKATSNRALAMGEPRTLHTKWHEEDQHTRLKLQVQPQALLFICSEPMYLDTNNMTIGVIETSYTNAQCWMMLNAPEIPDEMIMEFSSRLMSSAHQHELTPPKPIETININDCEPTPVLFLYGEPFAGDRQIHMMRLGFEYKETEIGALSDKPFASYTQNDTLYRIQRQTDIEQQCITQITDIGFIRNLYARTDNTDDLILYSIDEIRHIATARWHTLTSVYKPQLEAQGWKFIIDPSFYLQFIETTDNWDIEVKDDNDWFELSFEIKIDDKNSQAVSLLPLLASLLKDFDLENMPESITIPMENHQHLAIKSERIKPVLEILYELYDSPVLNNGALRLSRYDAARLHNLEQATPLSLQWAGGEKLRQLASKLADFNGIQAVTPPQKFNAILRDYQQKGLNWLQFIREYEFNGILADDMGLGKTIQTLALLLLEKQHKRLIRPCLIIAPTSLMSNWRREAEQFAPDLNVLVLHGANRKQYFTNLEQFDIVLSTYPLVVRDKDILLSYEFYYLILDEAQIIKNPKAKAAQIVRNISADHRLCLTGTPMENHLGELWALFDFLMPGFLGSKEAFNHYFRNPIERDGNQTRNQQLSKRVSPFMLRRTKQEVVKELPEKTEIIRTVALDNKQASLYESIRISMEKKIQDAIASKGLARSHITILDALLKLRQTCCDPRLLTLKQATKVNASAKMELLMTMVPELVEEGRKILLFSQFTKMLGLIEDELNIHNISYSKLTGQTRKREQAIEKFRSGEVSVFLISLKAGGVGLNLTEADTVIHYDPWWNPAAENQATDRAYRIGQDKPVFVYKLITENTLEEKILAMQERKQSLANGIYSHQEKEQTVNLTPEILEELFSPLSAYT